MKDFSNIPTLSSYTDWLIKAEKEFSSFEETYNIYDAANCLLSLSCLPEWIKKSSGATETLRILATEKENIMRYHKLDASNLSHIDNKLRLIRLFCNHAKHGEKKRGFVSIQQAASLPSKLPVRFKYLCVGAGRVKIVDLCNKVIEFWKQNI